MILKQISIQKYNHNKPEFSGVYSIHNLPKIKNGGYVINHDEYESIETHWIVLYENGNNRRVSYDVINFNRFGVEHTTKKHRKQKYINNCL